MTDTNAPRPFTLDALLEDVRAGNEIDPEYGYGPKIVTDGIGRDFIEVESYDEDGNVSHKHRVYLMVETTEVTE